MTEFAQRVTCWNEFLPRAVTLRLFHHATAREVARIIEQRVPSGIRLSDVARQVHLTQNSLCNYFSRNVGMSVADLSRRMRMGHAAAQLRSTSASIEAIAHSMGYRDPSNFARAFKNVAGVTPIAYRKQKTSVSFSPVLDSSWHR